MAGHSISHFHNEGGHRSISIGVREFMCVGARAPHDHPHVYLDMGDEDELVCPYCSTLYRYDATLEPDQSIPEGCVLAERAA